MNYIQIHHLDDCIVDSISFSVLPYLSEADLSIIILVNFFDHGLETEMSLWLTKFLHHQLQLHKVNEITAVYVIPV